MFEINSASGTGTLVKVKQVDVNGAIRAVEIILFGTGYAADFNILISPSNFIDYAKIGSRIQVGNLTYQSDDNATTQNESGQIVRHTYTNLDFNYVVDPTYVGDIVGEIVSQPGLQTYANYATLRFTTGSLCIYPGYYKTNDNILGDVVVIQDSYYYQAFSYVTSLETQLNQYAKVLRSVMHPAGTKHFGIFQMNYQFQLDPAIDPVLNIIAKGDAIRDLVFTDDQIQKAAGKTVSLSVTVQDEAIKYLNGLKYLDKYLIETITTGTGPGGVYKNPDYVLQDDPSAYWQGGYIEDERPINN